jgi:hypothetical protein
MEETQTELAIKAAVRERDGYSCVDCGMSNDEHVVRYGSVLEVHRKSPGKRYSVVGCETVCKTCHGKRPKSPYGRAASPMIKVPLIHRLILNQLAKNGNRPVSYELRKALESHFKECGAWPPSQDILDLADALSMPKKKRGRPKGKKGHAHA